MRRMRLVLVMLASGVLVAVGSGCAIGGEGTARESEWGWATYGAAPGWTLEEVGDTL